MQTVLITGCSSGFGLATAHYFLERDWNVVATMRTPREDLFPVSPRLKVLQLDVTDAASIRPRLLRPARWTRSSITQASVRPHRWN